MNILLVLKLHRAKMILHQAIFRKLASRSIEDSRGFCGRPREPRDDSASGAGVFGVGIVPARSIGLTFCRQQQVAAMNRKSRHVGLRRLYGSSDWRHFQRRFDIALQPRIHRLRIDVVYRRVLGFHTE